MLCHFIQGDLLAMINFVNLLRILMCTDHIKTMGEGGRLSLTLVPGSHQSISASANRSSWEVERKRVSG